jgi:transcriptional regulator with XRE-family HTH domain
MSDGSTTVKTKPEKLRQDTARMIRRREAAGLNMRRAAEKAGCSYTYLSELENGWYSAGVDTLVKLSTAYGCEITDLMPEVAA